MNFQFERFDHVQLAAPIGGEEKARSFYQGLLGMVEVEKPAKLKMNGGVWFQSNTVAIHIGVEDPFTPAKKAHPAIHVNNIEALKDYLDSKKVTYKVDENLPGANRFYLMDPFGNRLEFLEWE